MKNLTFTIVRKECARFFGDKTLFFTTVIMPGLLIYIIYSVMGSGFKKMFSPSEDPTAVYVQNMCPAMDSLFQENGLEVITEDFCADSVKSSIADKTVNSILISFPANLQSAIEGKYFSDTVPNIGIYYNSLNTTADHTYSAIVSVLSDFENSLADVYDINRVEEDQVSYDQASDTDEIGTMMKSLFPMLLMILIFSGCMAVTPNAIAGEKERGTIATLLVTPMKRSQLALGKVLALSFFVLLSGLSSFLGIIFSLPKLIPSEEMNISISSIYSPADYALLLLLIMATTLLLVSLICILSAWAKDVKSAGTMISPLMILVMFISLAPMLQGDAAVSLGYYLIPVYNSVLCMSDIFSFDMNIPALLITIGSDFLYTAIAVFIVTRMFNSERIMFGK